MYIRSVANGLGVQSSSQKLSFPVVSCSRLDFSLCLELTTGLLWYVLGLTGVLPLGLKLDWDADWGAITKLDWDADWGAITKLDCDADKGASTKLYWDADKGASTKLYWDADWGAITKLDWGASTKLSLNNILFKIIT